MGIRLRLRRLALVGAALTLAALALASSALAQTATQPPSQLSNLALWSLVAGAAVPAVVAIVKQTHWSARAQAAVMFVVSCVAAAGTAYWKSDLTGRTWVESLLLILASGLAYYHGIWKPTGAGDWLASKTDLAAPKKKRSH